MVKNYEVMKIIKKYLFKKINFKSLIIDLRINLLLIN